MVELGLLSFGDLAFEIQRRASKKKQSEVARRWGSSSGNRRKVAPASKLSSAVSRLVKNNEKEMTLAE